jgi:hypothetical protein
MGVVIKLFLGIIIIIGIIIIVLGVIHVYVIRPWVEDAQLRGGIATNETSTILRIQKLYEAEKIWYQQDLDNNKKSDYWTLDISCLYRVHNIGKTTSVELILSDLASADANPYSLDNTQPFGDQATDITIEPFKGVCKIPVSGYNYRAMLTNTSGEPYNQNEVGTNHIKATNSKEFAFVAFPDWYGRTGKQTFIINQDGKIYSKDLEGKLILQWPDKNPERLGWNIHAAKRDTSHQGK